MKCISLWAPWSDLIAIGAKKIETRSWGTEYRGPIAIHSAKKWDDNTERASYAFRNVLRERAPEFYLGKLVCYADLVTCRQVNSHAAKQLGPLNSVYMIPPERPELDYGDYNEGRYGWFFENIRVLKKTIAITGRQRIFNVPLIYCDSCDGTGLMEGWNHRDGHPCPKCWGDCLILDVTK